MMLVDDSHEVARDSIVTINIAGKQFRIKCAPAERAILQEAEAYLSQRVLALQQLNHFASLDHLIVIIALNLYQELSCQPESRMQSVAGESDSIKINSLIRKIKNVLATQ